MTSKGRGTPVLIAQITDIHIGFDPGNRDEANARRLAALVARLTSGPNRPDLVLLSGDLTEFGDVDSFARLAELVAPLPCPVWPMVGNHDDRAALLAAFPATPAPDGFVQYVLVLDGFRLIVLDTLEPGRQGGAFCAARAEWLSAQLSADPLTPVVIAMHHPPFESGIAWLDGSDNEPWIARFAATIAGHSQIRAIIAGHLHRSIHTLWNGVPVLVCPSSAAAVALDLTPADPDRPDGRAMIVDEPARYALHRWDGTRLVTHFDSVADWPVLARYDVGMQQVVRQIAAERG
jgi:Icc protein